MSAFVSAINVASLKSGRAISVSRAEVNERGLAYDREWMAVDALGRFLSQRDVPRLALIMSRLDNDTSCVWFSAPGMPDLFGAPLVGLLRFPIRVTVHKDSCDALHCGVLASEWFSEFLERDVILVRIDPANPRKHHSSVLDREFPANFQDGSHALIISRASLDDFNGRVAESLPMDRFRPTIEVSGVSPYEEDTWRNKHIRIGNLEMLGANLNVRCVVTTIDQETGQRDPRQEPLRTLATYRRTSDGEVVFGINCYVIKPGFVNVGDTVEILS